MGVLDEAIRQHLELKRAHGASEEELRRQEAEALGPARREPGPGGEDDESAVAESAAEAPAGPASGPTTSRPGPRRDEPAPDRPEAGAEEADEVPAEEALEEGGQLEAGGGHVEAPAEPVDTSGPKRVFDVEELGSDEPVPARPTTGPEPVQGRGAPQIDDPDADEAVLDAEEEAEEELADELAAGAERSEPPASEVEEGAGGRLSPEPPVSPPLVSDDPLSVEEDTIYRPPPLAAAEAETDEYLIEEDEPGDRPGPADPAPAAAEGEPGDEALLAEDDLLEEGGLLERDEELLEEEDDLLEEQLEAEDELEAESELDADEDLGTADDAEGEEEEVEAGEVGPPADRHDPADEDLDLEDDLEAGSEEQVLEETPEFFQEQAEDERLWSEQSPPRDFDLDR